MQILWSSCKLFIWFFGVKGFLFHRKDVAILWCFYVGRGWTPCEELYGIVDQSINLGLSMHEPIGIPKLSTFDAKLWMIPIVCSTNCFSVTGRDWFFEVLACSFSSWGWRDSCFTGKMWRSSDVLLGGHGWTPRDELYGIADQLIAPGLGLHEQIGIPELSTFDAQLCMIFTVSNSFFVTGLYKFLQASKIMKLLHIKKNTQLLKHGIWRIKKKILNAFQHFVEVDMHVHNFHRLVCIDNMVQEFNIRKRVHV